MEHLPQLVRVKVGYAPDLEPKVELSEEEAECFGLLGAAEEAALYGREREDALRRFGRDYPLSVSEPSIILLPREKVASLAEKLESHGISLFQGPIILKIGETVLTLAVEFECG